MSIDWSAPGLVLLVGLGVGAGLVALFAFGVAAIAGPAGADRPEAGGPDTLAAAAPPPPRHAGAVIGYVCLTLCAVVVLYGIYLAVPSLHKLV
jgi:hypothetical protein